MADRKRTLRPAPEQSTTAMLLDLSSSSAQISLRPLQWWEENNSDYHLVCGILIRLRAPNMETRQGLKEALQPVVWQW